MSKNIQRPSRESDIALLDHPPVQPVEEAVQVGVSVAAAVDIVTRQRELAAPVMTSEVDIPAGATSGTTMRERFRRTRTGRLVMSSLAALGLASAGVVVDASPALANPVYTVVNPDNDGTRSIYDRNSPRMADTTRTYPDFSYYGDRLELICGTNGEAVGPKNNKRWHYAKNLSRPEAGVTWIPDRYMNTPNKANQPTPGEAECGAAPQQEAPKPVLSVKGCYYNMKAPSTNLTFSYSGDHRYLGNAWQAAKNWTDLHTGISINQTSGTAYIRFKDIYSTDKNHQWYASADVPNSWQSENGKEYLKQPPKNPHKPSYVTVYVNQAYMDKLDDFHRTYAIGHEIAHTLGMAHADRGECGVTDKTITQSGGPDVPSRTFNKPTYYDRISLEQLYNLPRH